MHSVKLSFTRGPMAGESIDYDLGALTLGREPAQMEPGQMTLVLKGAESSVSRSHATLLDSGGNVLLRNLSGNGTLVDGKLVLEDAVLEHGSKIKVGSSHEFIVNWEVIGEAVSDKDQSPISAGALVKAGPLASPVVRAFLLLYLVGILGVVGWLMTRASGGAAISDDWPSLEASYAEYLEEHQVGEAGTTKMDRAAALVNQVRILRIKGRTGDVNSLCRELMALDADVRSPIYKYGARCLGGF